jgi:3-hydroxyacyl-CoA dehydrogenase
LIPNSATVAYVEVAMELWLSGCADIVTIDKVAKDFGFPKGPFTTMDSV